MEESKYTKKILEEFKSKFPDNWIEQLNWEKAKSHKSFKNGFSTICSFQTFLFENLAKLVLSADHFVCKTDSLEQLLNQLEGDIVPTSKNTLKNKLQTEYANLYTDIHDSLYLVKYHKDLINGRFKQQSKKVLIRAIPFKYNRSNRNKYVSLLDDICDACWFEYIFSYDETYIRTLLMLKEKLNKISQDEAGEIVKIVNVTINKIEFLLKKLTFFSKNKRITYNYDFHETTINTFSEEQYKDDDFRRYFLDFMDIERISPEKIGSWQDTLQKDNVKMWHFVFLMRYYVKVTRSKEQIDKLIELFDKHYSENLKDPRENIVNKFACKSGKNYMYNSRFSYYCKLKEEYSFDQMKADLNKIETIQNETFIFNYHPYQKAIEFANRHLTESIEKNESIDVLNQILSFIKDSYKKFKNNVEWCNTNQPYLLQLRFDFSKITDQDLEVFYPSAFCRPLRFQDLNEKIQEISNEINMLEYQVKHHTERLEIKQTKDAIKQMQDKNDEFIKHMQKKNNEILARYASIATFLVGLLSIFIGNKEEVSIFTKMEYVVALGVILIMFVSVGYFFTSESFKKFRTFVFVLITAASILYIGSFTFQTIQHHHRKESANNNFTYNNTKCKNDTVCKGHQTDTRNK